MRTEWNSVSCDSLGVLRAHGPDVVPFLQGQLSNDLTRLSPARALLAGYHNPQGRVIALLRLVQVDHNEVLAVLPRELVAPVMSRLARYILRAKVKLAEESAHWSVSGLMAPQVPASSAPPSGAPLPATPDSAARVDGAIAVRVADAPARWLLIAPASTPAALGGYAAGTPLLWQHAAIAAGEAQVYAATSEEFVAQMLNLDVAGAIDFDKGCYTGQEVIARAHYRGRVKRRLQRFLTSARQPLKPGDAGTFADGRAFKVVDAVALEDGRCEFLAVAPLAPESAAAPASASAGARAIEAEQLPLPYALPP